MPTFKELNKKLADLFPEEKKARRMLKYARISTGNIDFDGSAMDMWFSILDECEKHKTKLPALIEQAHSQYPEDDLLIEAMKDIEDGMVIIEEPASGRFQKYLNSNVQGLTTKLNQGENEAVLNEMLSLAQELNSENVYAQVEELIASVKSGTPLTNEKVLELLEIIKAKKAIPENLNVDASAMEKIMGGMNTLQDMSWITKAANASKSVCKVALTDGFVGTGWIVAEKYVMTNNHVIPDASVAKSSQLLFNFEEDKDEEIFKLNPDGFFHTNFNLDYSVIEIVDNGNLSNYGSLKLETFADPQVDQLVNIIQHPGGERKKIAMPDKIIGKTEENQSLFYLADTKKGSSGSPVFNQDWNVVALHHAGKTDPDNLFKINDAGEEKPANKGILIKAIIKDLEGKLDLANL